MTALNELYQHYRRLPHGSARADAIRSAISQADLMQDHFWRFHMRDDLMIELAFHGDEGVILPIITEMMEIYENHPISNAEDDYVYAIYLSISQWTCHPQLPLSQLDTMMNYYKKVVDQYQIGDASYYERCCEIAIKQQQWDTAQTYYEKTRHTQFSDTSTCAACKCYFAANYFLETRQKEEALAAARPILDGSHTCEQHPAGLLSDFLDFALNYETLEEADHWAHLLCRELHDTYDCAMLRWLAYRAVPKALSMLESGIIDMWGQWDQHETFCLCVSAWVVCLQYSKQHTEPAPLTLPHDFPLWQQTGLYNMDTLGTFFYDQANKIAQAFDARNHSKYYQNKLEHANYLG